MSKNPLIEALEADMADLELSQDQLGVKLDVSQQAVSNWFTTGHIPYKRRGPISELLGTDSRFARLAMEQPHLPYITDGGRRVAAERAPRGVSVERDTRRVLREPLVRYEPPTATESTRRPPYAAAMEFHLALLDCLPEAVAERMSHSPQRVQIGSISKSFDYVSENVVLEVKTLKGPHSDAVAKAGLLDLAVARSGTFDNAFRTYVLALLNISGSPLELPHRMQSLLADASLLGVTVFPDPAPAQLAKYIMDAESENEGRRFEAADYLSREALKSP